MKFFALLLLTAVCACADGPAPTDVTTTTTTPSRAAVDVDRGAAIVDREGCPVCHQASDAGAGVLAGQTSPRPGTHAFAANLTPDPDTGIGSWTDDAIVRAIRTGVDDQGETLCETMPRFSDLNDADAAAIVAYLRTLAPVHREIPASECEGPTPD